MNDFGYPSTCNDCSNLPHRKGLLVKKAYYNKGNELKLMLIGQDPTIYKQTEDVEVPLMLNSSRRNTLRKWLVKEVGIDIDKLTVYATNVVKCTFDEMPSRQHIPALRFLESYYENCQKYLIKEIKHYGPHVVLAFGESAHKLFIRLLDSYPKDKLEMNRAFDGTFEEVKLIGSKNTFKYSPCLHIKTFRVAKTYGERVKKFEEQIKVILG